MDRHTLVYVDIDIEWVGKEENEKGINKKNGKVLVEVDPKYYRPTEVHSLRGDFSKAEKLLGWKPKTKFKDLVKLMMKNDIDNLTKIFVLNINHIDAINIIL